MEDKEVVSTNAADAMAPMGARLSAAMVLTQLT